VFWSRADAGEIQILPIVARFVGALAVVLEEVVLEELLADAYRLPEPSSQAAMTSVTTTRVRQSQRFDFEPGSHFGQFIHLHPVWTRASCKQRPSQACSTVMGPVSASIQPNTRDPNGYS
jgi:hypothetical protein